MPPGTRVGESGAVVDVRASASDAVVLLRWGRDPNVYGIPIPLGAVDTFFGWPDEGIEQRLADLDITLMEELDTGLMHRARRRLVGDYIELTGPDWPYDQRFYPSVAYPGHGDPRALSATMRAAGLDPALALARAEAGTLVAWVVAHENNRQGMPYMGQAVVTGLDEEHAELELLELASLDLPDTVSLDLAHLASHLAGEAGFRDVRTRLDLPVLRLAGYRDQGSGAWAVDTRFLDEDLEAAAALLAESLKRPEPWGQDRDLLGRHLPGSRTQRWAHRLRHPLTGRSPRTFITLDTSSAE